MFNTNLSAADRQNVTAYLSNKWGLIETVDSDEDGIFDNEEFAAGTEADFFNWVQVLGPILPSFSITVVNTNDAPSISGLAETSINEDSTYSFTPTGSDIDAGDVLTYSINNQPNWQV